MDFCGDLIADGFGDGFTVNYGGLVIRWRCHSLEEIRWVGTRDVGVEEGFGAVSFALPNPTTLPAVQFFKYLFNIKIIQISIVNCY